MYNIPILHFVLFSKVNIMVDSLHYVLGKANII